MMEFELLLQLWNKSNPEKLATAAGLLADVGALFRQETVDQILAELLSACDGDQKNELLAWAEGLPESPSAEYLCAQLAALAGNFELAIAHYRRLMSLAPERDPLILLSCASALSAQERFGEAASILRRALKPVPRYSFFTRAAQVIRNLEGRDGAPLRHCRIALLAASTTGLLVPILRALCLRDQIEAEFYEGLYGSIDQEILDHESGLARFRPDFVFILTHWRSLQLPAVADDESSRVRDIVETQKDRWHKVSGKFACHVVQQNFDFPGADAYGYLASSLPGGRNRIIQLVNLRLQEEVPPYVSLLDSPPLQREVGLSKWQDEMQWHSFQQHPSTEALPVLADAMLAHLRAVLGLTRKMLVTDLDNTLWKGVIGEDGLDGIRIGPGSPHGEAHQRLQQYLVELKARGILLAVASKNNYEDACLPFQKHDHMLLRMGDFAAFEANWNDKASNLREIARKLSLGLDSFVFLDDDPHEREWVRSQLPEVAIVELGSSVFHFIDNLDRGRYFCAISLSAEDRGRAAQYSSQTARNHLQATAQSLDEFLAQLNLRARRSRIDSHNLARVTQLINKTNQFNLVTRRYTEAQAQKLVEDPQCWAGAFHLADKMGEYGLIGVIFCRPLRRDQWEVDTWLMSCRVLGRQMEKFMFDRLVEAARMRSVQEIFGVYRPTPKNALVKDHYDKLGFERISETPEEIRYRLLVPAHNLNTTTHIHDETDTTSITTS